MKLFIKTVSQTVFLFLLCVSSVWAQEETDATQKITDIPENLMNVAQEQLDTAKKLIDVLVEFGVKYSFQVVGGLIVLFLGWMVANFTAKMFSKILQKNNVDITVCKFILGTIRVLILAFAIIVALGKFGIEIAPLIAGISVIGVGISFALQGPLSNYAAGASLIFTKAFKIGDIIEVADVNGEVVDIKLPRTEIRTIDGNLVIIPNRHIIGEIIHNFSTAKRLDITVGVAYSSDVEKAIQIVADVIKSDDRVVRAPNVGISDFGDSSVNIYARLWCQQKEYWNVKFDINKKIFYEFKAQGIEIPFPQRDVHIIKEGI